MNRLAAGLESSTSIFLGTKRSRDDDSEDERDQFSKKQCLRGSPQSSPGRSTLLKSRRVRELRNSPSKGCGIRPCTMAQRKLFGENLFEQRSKRKLLCLKDVPPHPSKKMKFTESLPKAEDDEVFEQLLEKMEECALNRIAQ